LLSHPRAIIGGVEWRQVVVGSVVAVSSLAIGFVLSEVSGFLKLRRERVQRRQDFQRDTILELQECLARIVRATSRAYFEMTEDEDASGIWRSMSDTHRLAEGVRDAQERASVLAVRLADSDLRRAVEQLRETAREVIRAPDRPTGDGLHRDLAIGFTSLNQAFGKRLRSID
jgi:hypothetical protein